MGYRSMWKCLRDKYNLIVRRYCIPFYIFTYWWLYAPYRDTVMQVLRELNPEGTSLRASHRLKRRMYYSKVHIYYYVIYCLMTVWIGACIYVGSKFHLAYGSVRQTGSFRYLYPRLYWWVCDEKHVTVPMLLTTWFFMYSFSRKIVWLRVESTNSDSGVILGYYLDAVGHFGGN